MRNSTVRDSYRDIMGESSVRDDIGDRRSFVGHPEPIRSVSGTSPSYTCQPVESDSDTSDERSETRPRLSVMAEVEDVYFANSINSNGTYGTKTANGNSRIFNCKHCSRAFTREEHLSRHVLSTHNKLKPFVCGICARPFSRRDLLLRHAQNLHLGSEAAVSRIRKSYKKSEEKPGEKSPGEKKMKISVDMLVS